MMRRQDQQSRVFYELSRLVLTIIRFPPTTFQFSDDRIPVPPSGTMVSTQGRTVPHITPAGFASLMLGISLSLMLGGSVTFFIGFMLMPWVIGLILVFYLVGFVSSLSVLGRSIICYASSSSCSAPSSPRKDVRAWKLM